MCSFCIIRFVERHDVFCNTNRCMSSPHFLQSCRTGRTPRKGSTKPRMASTVWMSRQIALSIASHRQLRALCRTIRAWMLLFHHPGHWWGVAVLASNKKGIQTTSRCRAWRKNPPQPRARRANLWREAQQRPHNETTRPTCLRRQKWICLPFSNQWPRIPSTSQLTP